MGSTSAPWRATPMASRARRSRWTRTSSSSRNAFFWVGNKTPRPSPEGDLVPFPEDFKG
ncbi:hypothetical protein FOCC_FOCC013897, partial [Frankliniella occidentalis]